MLVRCSHCNRTGLPVVPNSIGGNGTLAIPVAHVKHTYIPNEPVAPCFQGVSRDLLSVCVEPGIMAPQIAHQKEMIMSTEALWEL